MSVVLGIDLGTTNSAMAYVVGGKPTIIENAEGARTTPSVFYYNTKDETVVVGEVAKRNSVLKPENTFYEVKRFIGRSFEDEQTQSDAKMVPYKVEEKNGKIKVSTKEGKEYSPEQVSAAVLRKLKTDAEAKLGQTISEAVVTVPAYFNDAQRQATKDAGEIAGLKVLRIINEPTAAALAYGFEKGQDEKVLVYDLGGGTFDVTVLDISNETIEVLATNGDTHLGGKDFDKRLIDYVIAEFKKDTGIDLSKDKAAVQRVKEAVEKAKQDLSTQQEHQVNLPFITMGADNQPQHLMLNITRSKFEELVADLIDKTMDPVKKALDDAGVDKKDIQEIIMVGGMTRVPSVQKAVENYFNKKPNLSVNPDEVVALGAAIQGAVLKGDVKDILLLDVTPLTLAIETAGNIATPMIPRNTTIPASKSQIFSTYADNQTAVDVHVVQGERPMASDNKSLGKFTLSGIPPAPRGVPQIEVTFDLDANGILKVTAVDKGSGKQADITITGSSTLSEDEKNKAIEEAERQKEADKTRKAMIEARNNADSVAYQTGKLLDEMKDKIDETDQEELKKLKEEVEVLSKDENATKTDLEAKSKQLQDKMMSIGEKIYSAQAGSQAQSESEEQAQTETESAETKDTEEAVQDVESEKKEPESDKDKKK